MQDVVSKLPSCNPNLYFDYFLSWTGYGGTPSRTSPWLSVDVIFADNNRVRRNLTELGGLMCVHSHGIGRIIYAVRSAPQLIARAYPHIARRTYLPPIARTPGFPLGEVSRLGLDRAEGRKSVALISTLFRGSFEVNIVIFLEVGRVAGLPEARDPIAPITFRPPRNFELALVGRHAFEKGTTGVRHPMRVPGVIQIL
jgi:hypothetical protein